MTSSHIRASRVEVLILCQRRRQPEPVLWRVYEAVVTAGEKEVFPEVYAAVGALRHLNRI